MGSGFSDTVKGKALGFKVVSRHLFIKYEIYLFIGEISIIRNENVLK